MFFPIRLLKHRWPKPVERLLARFVWQDPTCILDPGCTPEDFRRAMSALHVGATIKITGADRHPEVDDLLVEHVDLTGAHIADIGASDGSTSVDLIRRLPAFASYVIADLYLHLSATTVGPWTVLTDGAGTAILVVGPRTLAWPSVSRAVRLLTLPIVRASERRTERSQPVLLLNPAARQVLRSDTRVSYRAHDVFVPWAQPAGVNVIKVANLLRRLYFSDEQIEVGLAALHASLPEGGHLLIVDNPRVPGGGARGGLYRREGNAFSTVATRPEDPEIHDLVTSFRSSSAHTTTELSDSSTQSTPGVAQVT